MSTTEPRVDRARAEKIDKADRPDKPDKPDKVDRVEVRTDRRSVLPWRRQTVDAEVAPLVGAYLARHRRADTTLIEHAYDLARDAHREQVRRSGEPYIT